MVDPANYKWLAVEGRSGVWQKPLGTFTERLCAAALLKLARGASCRVGPRSVCLVLSGSGVVHEAPYRRLTAFHLDDGEQADVVARDETEILRLTLPDLAGLATRRTQPAQAAE